jgi:hypothetical protein
MLLAADNIGAGKMAGEIRRCERLPLAVKFLTSAKGYEHAPGISTANRPNLKHAISASTL